MVKIKNLFKMLCCFGLVFIVGISISCCSDSSQEGIKTASSAIKTDFTVVFQDYDGTVLSSQTVALHQAAVAPNDPSKEGGVFVGWNRDFSCITKDITVVAQYAWTVHPSVMAVSMIARPGETVKLPVAVVNNPGIAGSKVTIVYDPAIKLKDSESGEAFSVLDFTKPGKYKSPCNFTWDSEKGMAKNDGEILWLIFDIPADAPAGKIYSVNCVCKKGNTYDENLTDVSLDVINGTITVE